MFGGKLGIPELILILIPVLYTWMVYAIGKKVGYGKALQDYTAGKFTTNSPQSTAQSHGGQ